LHFEQKLSDKKKIFQQYFETTQNLGRGQLLRLLPLLQVMTSLKAATWAHGQIFLIVSKKEI